MDNLTKSQQFIKTVMNMAKLKGLNVFVATDGASGYSNSGNDCLSNLRKAQMEWEKIHGINPNADWTENTETFKEFQKRLSNCHWGVLGGAVRSFLEHRPPRDIDIVYDGELNLEGLKYKTNHFGGTKIRLLDVEVDIWPIGITYAFRNNYMKASFENLTKTALVSCDSLFYDVTEKKLYSDWYRQGKHKKELLLNKQEDYFADALKVEPEEFFKKVKKLNDFYNNIPSVCDYLISVCPELISLKWTSTTIS